MALREKQKMNQTLANRSDAQKVERNRGGDEERNPITGLRKDISGKNGRRMEKNTKL